MKQVYIVGEDPVTFAVIKKIIACISTQIKIISELPARGGQIKNKIPEFNVLSKKNPIILLMDLDNSDYCAPKLLKRLITDKNKDFIINIAVDEAEAWLMADREGFANYFCIDLKEMPDSYKTK